MRIFRRSRLRRCWLGIHGVNESIRIHRTRETALNFALRAALFLACMVSAAPQLCAQAPDAGGAPGPGQNQPAAGGGQNSAPQQQPSQTKPQTNVNPFPDNTDSVPVMPTRETPDLPPSAGDESPAGLIPLPAEDADPM